MRFLLLHSSTGDVAELSSGVDKLSVMHGELPGNDLHTIILQDVAQGLDLDRPVAGSSSGRTRLCQATQDGNLPSAQLLLAQKADPSKGNAHGYTPLHFAAQHDQAGMAQILLQAGADPNKKNSFGGTPLYYAVDVGHDDVAALISAAGGVSEGDGGAVMSF